MDNLFGIDNKIVKAALVKGIKIKKDGVFINVPGFVALIYMVQFNKFILTYGSGAKDAGYVQLELNAVAENERAMSLYRSLGFVEFGRNPRGFNSRVSGYQELVYMLLEL